MSMDFDLCQPLDHSAPNTSRDDHSDGEAVIWCQQLAIVLVGNQDVIGWIHSVAIYD